MKLSLVKPSGFAFRNAARIKHIRFLWSNLWDVSERIELDGLVAGIVAGHVALAAVDAHLGVDQGHNVLPENCTFIITAGWK